jgi:hypothetical protein
VIALLTIVAGALAAVLVTKQPKDPATAATGSASAPSAVLVPTAGAAPGSASPPSAGSSAPAAVDVRGRVRFAIEPAGAVVAIGASDTGHAAPYETDLDPGIYSISIRYPGYQARDLSITVASGTRQIVDLALEPAPGSGSAIHATHHAGAVPKHVAAHETEPVAPPMGPAPGTASPGTPDATPPPPPITPPVANVPQQSTGPQPPPPAQKDKRVTPVVASNAVTKLSGELPVLRGENDGDVLAKICIDDHGSVSSVKVLKSPADIADALQHAMTTWRYKPYTGQDGTPSAVCFPLQLHVVVKRPD